MYPPALSLDPEVAELVKADACGVQDCQDHSSRPHKLPWKATDEERAIVCALRQATEPMPHAKTDGLFYRGCDPRSGAGHTEGLH